MKSELCIVIIAHNQCKLVQQQLKNYEAFAPKKGVQILVVDNASTDTALYQWLQKQHKYQYIRYEEMEDFSIVLNKIIHKQAKRKDIFILGAHMILLPYCIERMQEVLYQDDMVGAVCPEAIFFGAEHGKNVMEAIQYVQKVKAHKSKAAFLNKDAVCFRHDFLQKIGDFEQSLLRPDEVIQEQMIRGREKEYSFYNVQGADVFQLIEPGDMYQKKYGVGY